MLHRCGLDSSDGASEVRAVLRTDEAEADPSHHSAGDSVENGGDAHDTLDELPVATAAAAWLRDFERRARRVRCARGRKRHDRDAEEQAQT